MHGAPQRAGLGPGSVEEALPYALGFSVLNQEDLLLHSRLLRKGVAGSRPTCVQHTQPPFLLGLLFWTKFKPKVTP